MYLCFIFLNKSDFDIIMKGYIDKKNNYIFILVYVIFFDLKVVRWYDINIMFVDSRIFDNVRRLVIDIFEDNELDFLFMILGIEL